MYGIPKCLPKNMLIIMWKPNDFHIIEGKDPAIS